MIIGVAGPYSAGTEAEIQLNLQRLNNAAAKLLEMGHIPLIGIHAALPITSRANIQDVYKANMDISMAVISACEAILVLAESPGATREKDFIAAKGLPVYFSMDEIPKTA